MTNQEQVPDTPPTTRRRHRRGWHRLRRTFIWVVLILVVLLGLLQLPSFQNWLVRQATNGISETLETEVRIGYARLSWFDKLTIQDVFIEDKYGDTLLVAGRLDADFEFLSILSEGLKIEAVSIADTRFTIRRDLGDPESNLEYALEKLFPPKDEPGKPISLQLERLDLSNITFVQNDSVRGQRFDIFLNEGVVRMRELDLPGKVINVRSSELRGPVVRQTSFTPSPLPVTPQMEASIRRQDSLARDTNQVYLRFLAGSIEIIDGSYTLDNFRKDPIEASDIEAVDFARLGTRDVDLELTDVDFYRGELTGKLKHLSLQEKSGFVLDRLSVQDLKITPTELQLYDLVLETPRSLLSDSLRFQFNDGWGAWTEFNDNVRMTIELQPSQVWMRDILYFARKLRFNPFARENRDEIITLGGQFSGRVNNLRARDVELSVDRQNFLRGSFSSRNLAGTSPALNLRIDDVNTDMTTLRRLIPSFRPPPNFDKLGSIRFNGSFDGFFTDFAAKGDLRTDIGRAVMDVQMNIENGASRALYGGALSLENFNLGNWTDNGELGNVNFSGEIRNGRGLVPETASADLGATIQSIDFRGYTYENARINGQLEQSFFNGSFEIADDNIDFSFLGELNFRDSIPVFDFDANIGKLDLAALNLSQKPVSLSGSVNLNLTNTDFSEMEGSVDLKNFQVLLDTVAIDVDSLRAYSIFNKQGEKVVKLESDIVRGELVGRFDLPEVTSSLTNFILVYYPGWANRLKIKAPRSIPPPNRFSFDVTIVDSKGLNRLVTPGLGPLVDVHLTGGYDGYANELDAELIAPRFSIDNVELVDLIVKTSAEESEGELDVIVDSTLINGKAVMNRLTLLSLITNDTIDFGLTYGGSENNVLLNKINLNGQVTLPDTANYAIRFEESDLRLFQEPWSIRRDNRIVFGPDYIDTRNFSLRASGDRRIRLTKRGERGLDLDFENMDLALIDSVWYYPPLDFSGQVDVHVSVENAFAMTGLSANILSDTFLINEDDYGYLRADLSAPDPRGKLTAFLNLNRDTAQLIAEASFNLGDLVDTPATADQRKGYLDLTATINGYPLSLAKYWVGESVSNIVGDIDAYLNVKGPTGRLDVNGYIDARAGAFTLDYLQTRYHFYRSRVNINNNLFDLAGTRLLDRYNNSALLTGGITHDRLKNLGINATLTTNKFLALDLLQGQNANFFGRALGAGTVRFTGNFRQTDIYVRATVGEGSKLSIPVSSGVASGPINNVRFVDRSVYVEEEETAAADPTGVSLTMELEVTDEAVGEIIFDEEVGDILRGRGNGDLTISIPRDGELQMRGSYNITAGNYLFTFYKVVNKEFEVRPGGKVTWTGDPFEAQIDIAADYQNLKTPLLNFIQEYLTNDVDGSLSQAASQATDVDLTLKLNGVLTQPRINFDISFPSIDGQLENYANNKRRLLLLDQNELNRQVFGLIVVGQFVPADLSFSGGDVAFNTVSEWLSNYLSLLLNGFLKETFGEDSFISSFDFDLAYNSFRNSTIGSENNGRGQAVEFSFRRDFNNRWSLSGDVNYLNNSQLASVGNRFFGNDLVIEYVLNDKRTLKLRFYQRYTPDIASDGRLQFGTGLSWRREFDSLREFFGAMKRDVN